MKIRTGFVSNSSSSSFIIGYKTYCKKDKEKLKNELSLFDRIIDYDSLFELFLKEFPDYDISQNEKTFKFNFWGKDIDLVVIFKPKENTFIIKAPQFVGDWDEDYEEIARITPTTFLAFYDDEPIDSETIDEYLYEDDYEYSDFDESYFHSEVQRKIDELEKINAKIIWDVGRDG